MIKKTNINKEISKRFDNELIKKINNNKKVIEKSDSKKTAKDNKVTNLKLIFNFKSDFSEYINV